MELAAPEKPLISDRRLEGSTEPGHLSATQRFVAFVTASVFWAARSVAARLSAFAVRFSFSVFDAAVLPDSLRADFSPMGSCSFESLGDPVGLRLHRCPKMES
jgi:hypothetical protein